jgi:fused signal recognition particle receptor
MEPVLVIAVLAVLVVTVGLAFVGARSRSRQRIKGLEPAPDAPRVTDEIREEARRRSQAIREAPIPESVPTVEEVIEQARREGEAHREPEAAAEPGAAAEPAAAEAPVEEAAPEAPTRPRFRDRLGRARQKLAGVFGSLRGATIDDETWEDLEYALIGADVGVEPTQALIEHLRERVRSEGLTTGDELLDALKAEMKERLAGHDLTLEESATGPSVWLLVGVNGVGKTTTIGKLGAREVGEGKTVVMAAGDTFRAAAAEQLTMWAERTGATVVRGSEGSDPSSVIFDAVESAAAKGADLVLADTAGRLHTKSNLMEELRKVRRVADKGAGTVTEVLLVLDATTGQNGLVQAQQFTEAVEVTGVVLTKLDGSAKGGIVFAIQSQLGIPVKLVGLGESAEDLVPFDADEFVEALFA